MSNPSHQYAPPDASSSSLQEVTIGAPGSLEGAFQSLANGKNFISIDDVAAVLTAGGQATFDRDELHLAFVRSGKDDQSDGGSEQLTLLEVAEVGRFISEDQKVSADLRLLTNPVKAVKAIIQPLKEPLKGMCAKMAAFCCPLSLGQCLCCNREDDTERVASRMKPTTRLVLIVALLSFFMALVVGGTAVALGWTSTVNAQYQSLKDELNLVLNAAESFTVVQQKISEQKYQLSTAQMLAEVINEVGYQTNLETISKAQLNGVRVTGLMVDSMNERAALDSHLAMAKNMANMLDSLCSLRQYTTLASAALLVNTLNRDRLSDNEEIILAAKNGSIVTVYSDLKWVSKCPPNGCSVATDSASPLGKSVNRLAASSFVGLDYTQSEVFGGYAYLECLQAGLLYQSKGAAVRQQFLQNVVASISAIGLTNRASALAMSSSEINIYQAEKFGIPLNVPTMTSQCPGNACGIDRSAGKAVLNAALGTNPIAIDTDYRQSVQVLSTAMSLRSLNATLVFQIDLAEIIEIMMPPLRKSSSGINSRLNGTLELIFSRNVFVNGTKKVEILTTRRLLNECPQTGCLNNTESMRRASNCEEGAGIMIDYRGKSVMSGYSCVDMLGLGISLKIDESELQQRSIAQLIDYSNSQNAQDESSLELVVGQADPATPYGYVTLSNPNGDEPAFTTHLYAPMAEALKRKQSGAMQTEGFYGQGIVARYGYSPSLGLGIVLKVDKDEMEKSSIVQMLVILFTAIGIAILGVAAVAYAANRLLGSITETWEKSQRIVEEQKKNFENLVSALYPKFASERLLSGDSQIVLELAEVTVFFSDIVGFTTISNRLTAQELMAWIGYTFGVMDHVAEFFSIYKIKTIGDAYYAIAGLPGFNGESDNHSLRMARFASTCAQFFSGKYAHPDTGSCLKMIAASSALVRKEKKAAMKKILRSSASASTRTSDSGRSSAADEGRCMMRYGLASGPVTAGVLPGKCPAFDVWGKTVNLASRMEGNSRPGAVLCSETVHRNLTKDPNNPFVFYDQISTFAKGFGNVPAFFISRSKEAPPKVLMGALNIEPTAADFLFEIEGMTIGGRAVSVKAVDHTGSFRKKPIGLAPPKSLAVPTDQSSVGIGAIPSTDPSANGEECLESDPEDQQQLPSNHGEGSNDRARVTIQPPGQAWK